MRRLSVMNIEDIIKQDTIKVDIDNIELPASMQPENNTDGPGNFEKPADGEKGSQGGSSTAATNLSLEQLAGLIMLGYNAVSTAVYRRIEPTFDASLDPEEVKAIQEPLILVLKEYDVQMTPVTALIVAVIGVNAVKVMQLMQYRKQLQAAMAENTEMSQNEERSEQPQLTANP